MGETGGGETSLIKHIKDKSSDVFVTFVSILIGVVLADLVEQARSRMHLWPLDFRALVNWAEISAIVGTAMAAWSGYTHLGITRRSVPLFGEAVSTTAAPMLLLGVVSFAGRDVVWPWFYAAALYIFAGVLSLGASAYYASRTEDDVNMYRLMHPLSAAGVLYAAVPAYVIAGMLDQRGLLPRWAELAAVASGTPTAIIFSLLFFRDWRRGLGVDR